MEAKPDTEAINAEAAAADDAATTPNGELSGHLSEAKPPVDLDAPSLYSNRELSWLDFNDRVHALAADASLPLLERAKFAAIWASNLDEFFMVRVAGLRDQVAAQVDAIGPDGLSAADVLDHAVRHVSVSYRRHYEAFENDLRPQLAAAGIKIVALESCSDRERDKLDTIFHNQIYPVLTPLAVGPGRPFPYISGLSLSIAARLRDPQSGDESFVRVKVPKDVIPRFVRVGRSNTFVPLEDLIAANLHELFPGMDVVTHTVFRVTRDADLDVSDEANDLLQAVEDELRQMRFGEIVRIELAASTNATLRDDLVRGLSQTRQGLRDPEVFAVDGLLDLNDLMQLINDVDAGRLRFPSWKPVTHPAFQAVDGKSPDIFKTLRDRDVLVQHPYDSFASSVEEFVRNARRDPDVLAIKQTVYRTTDDSSLVSELIAAAEAGKEAVCLLEVQARFDEATNIVWARRLEKAGVHVVHGEPGRKTHAKAILIVRREGKRVRRYAHIGTGNYHARTARLYEDFGLFTADPDITADIADLFNSLTGFAREHRFRKVVVAPASMRDQLLKDIAKVIKAKQNGEHARIMMKMNALVDPKCIAALYRASQAGVKIDLVVRGTCCLRPGIQGVSENIRVVSVVGRFLEHSRIYIFERAKVRRVLIGSADLMPRNLDTRVELLAPVEQAQAQNQLIDTVKSALADNTGSWELQAAGDWKRLSPGSHTPRSLQEEMMRGRTETEPVRLPKVRRRKPR